MRKILIILSLVFFGIMAGAQPLKLQIAESSMKISGTSSLHDWTSDVEEYEAQAILADTRIADIQFIAKVKSIKSGKSGMDNNTYKALNESEYPDISFTSAELTIEGDKLVGYGQLTIAGKTRRIPLNLTLDNNSKISVKGEVQVKMTDYGISPPTAVFGTIKTGDDITILFDFTLNKS
ncbi:MAG: YceI family protein [Reichenbachiella sp.]|uniref:YceI family protein n=1 Tax=Reichenbachiella sp. TaxID=2184521 RepID=UPI003266B99C